MMSVVRSSCSVATSMFSIVVKNQLLPQREDGRELTVELVHQSRETSDSSTDHMRTTTGQTRRNHRDEFSNISNDFLLHSILHSLDFVARDRSSG